ncbi:glycosyltransferase [Neomegalonema perideroedes]|uniref:glycosyltransferase n=1 Tax=Neomegalonema perideroedes TaxID=217219 RepID=UPI0003685815|nr:glycosyltransferase [Neomegalonema perideroedes]
MRQIATLWIGERLQDLEIASLWSFARQGHRVKLYAYGPLAGAPRGVEVADAGEILSGDPIVRHKSGSPALHSDLFRYALIAKTGAIWSDLDMIALKPFGFPSEHVFAMETAEVVGSAVLGLPQDSPALAALAAYKPETRGLPPHLKGLQRLRYGWRSLLAGGLPISHWPWGSVGPQALTRSLRETGEIRHALPPSAFYAVPMEEVARFCDPEGLEPARIPSEAYGLHLWANKLRQHLARQHGGRAPEGSYVARLVEEARRDGFLS